MLASNIPWDPVTIPLAAAGTNGDVREVPAFCDYIGIYDTTDDTAVQISFDNRTFFAANKGVYFRPAGGCDRAWFRNISGAAISVVVGKGLGDLIDNRLVISAATQMGIFGPDAAGSAPTKNPPGTAWDGALIRRLLTDGSGRMIAAYHPDAAMPGAFHVAMDNSFPTADTWQFGGHLIKAGAKPLHITRIQAQIQGLGMVVLNSHLIVSVSSGGTPVEAVIQAGVTSGSPSLFPLRRGIYTPLATAIQNKYIISGATYNDQHFADEYVSANRINEYRPTIPIFVPANGYLSVQYNYTIAAAGAPGRYVNIDGYEE